MPNSLLLLDKSSDIHSIVSNPENTKNKKIVCFDVESTLILSKLGINHELMENYVSLDDEKKIENLALEKATNWYSQTEINKSLIFQEINLGWLLEIEIHQYLLQIMKHYVGLIRVLEKENPSSIFASSLLSSLIKLIDFDSKYSITDFQKSNSTGFYFDTVEIPINLGIKKINFKASRKFALKIKKILENATNLFFNLKFKDNKPKKFQILFLEFNPVQYKQLLNEISSENFEIILLNERRPAVWNLESLKVVKNSKSKILSLSTLGDSLKNEIQDQKNQFLAQFENIIIHDEFFTKYFSIFNSSFWPSIKNEFRNTCKQRFSEAISRILVVNDFLKKHRIDYVLTMYNAGAEERSILSVIKKFNVPGILTQHGLYAQNSYIQNFIPVMGYLPNLGLKESVWGDETKNYFLDMGVDNFDLVVTGSPRHDAFFNYIPSNHTTNTILIATNVITGQNYNGMNSRIYKNFQKQIKEIIKLTNQIPDKKLILKLHPGKPPVDVISQILEEIDSEIEVSKTGNIMDYIINSDVVVSTEFSTVLIDAMILKKPTITFLFDSKGFENEQIIQSGATIHVKNLEEYKNALDKILTDKEYRMNQIERGSNFINKYMSNHSKASQFLAKYICEHVEKVNS